MATRCMIGMGVTTMSRPKAPPIRVPSGTFPISRGAVVGMWQYKCPFCGSEVLGNYDEAPDGHLFPDGYYKCTGCDYEYDEEDEVDSSSDVT